MADDDTDDDSTLVRTGKLALGYQEMVAFVKDIEERPRERLLSDLEGLMALPDSKYQLVALVLRKRMRPEIGDGPALVGRLRYLQKHAEDDTVRSRVVALFEKTES